MTNSHLCLPEDYNKFDLPLPDTVNKIDIGIDITDVLRINDKVGNMNLPHQMVKIDNATDMKKFFSVNSQ